MRLLLASSLFLTTTITALAQAPSPAPSPNDTALRERNERQVQRRREQSQTVIRLAGGAMPACPIGFTVQRGGLAVLRATGQGRPSPYVQPLKLRFSYGFVYNVASMTVIVHGSDGKSEVLPALDGRLPPDTATEVLHVSPHDRLSPVVDVATTRVPLVRRVELTEITYNNGTVWHEPAPNACSAAPSPFLLVNAEAR